MKKAVVLFEVGLYKHKVTIFDKNKQVEEVELPLEEISHYLLADNLKLDEVDLFGPTYLSYSVKKDFSLKNSHIKVNIK